MAILKVANIDVSKVSFTHKKNNYGTLVYINYENRPFMFQTPKMRSTGTKAKSLDDNSPITKYVLGFSFSGESSNAEVGLLHTKLDQINAVAKEYIIANSLDLFGKKMTTENFADIVDYRDIVWTFEHEGTVSQGFQTKVEYDESTQKFIANRRTKDEVMFFDKTKNIIAYDANTFASVVPSGSDVIGLVSFAYIFAGKNKIVQTKLNLIQAKVFKDDNSFNKYAIDDSDDEAAEAEGGAAEGGYDAMDVDADTVKASNAVDDSDILVEEDTL